MQLLFETTVTDIKVDTQTYIRAMLMIYHAQSHKKPSREQAHERSEYIQTIFANDSTKQDFQFGNELMFEYIKARQEQGYDQDLYEQFIRNGGYRKHQEDGQRGAQGSK